jgi:small subunit ribosomal protein S9
VAKTHETEDILATGRRKTSVAQVRLARKGQGQVLINSKSADDFFGGHERHKLHAIGPLKTVEGSQSFDVHIKVSGGGVTGQAGAIRHGIARALAKIEEKIRRTMRKEGFLTRDDRMVERKKSGRPKARKRFQYSKR